MLQRLEPTLLSAAPTRLRQPAQSKARGNTAPHALPRLRHSDARPVACPASAARNSPPRRAEVLKDASASGLRLPASTPCLSELLKRCNPLCVPIRATSSG